MPYTISYADLDGDAKAAKALADCRSYLGDKFKLICEAIKDDLADGVEERTLILHLDLFVGISGYPAQAMIDHARNS